jgi:RNA polymerase sigma-70 factor (ECF subfamily)
VLNDSAASLAAENVLGRGAERTRAESAPVVSTISTVQPVEVSEDTILVRRTLAGDQEAFTALVEKYKDPVFNVAYRMLGNPTEAEDVAQEAFVRAYTQLRTYKEQHRFSTWLLSIASHLAIDQIRRRRFLALPLENVPFLEWIADVGAGPEQSALQGEASDEMQRVLNALPTKYRLVLLLRYWYDFSYEEIAQTLDLTQPLVKARLHRARELVARTMKAQGLELPMTSEENDEPEPSQQPQQPRKRRRQALAH